MRLVYLGAEVPSNRKLLLESGVRAVGFSYLRARSRGFPKTKAFSFGNYFPDDCRIVVHPGITERTSEDLETVAADYQDFVVEHLDDIDAFVEFDSPQLGPVWREQQRTFYEQAGPKFWPVWDAQQGMSALQRLCERFPEVALAGDSIESETTLAAQARNLSSLYGTTFHALAVSRPDNLRQVPVQTASTLSWASPMMRGETIVWDGTSLKRYPKKMKEQARPRYKSIIESAGLNYELIISDDGRENSRLAVWSYQQLEKRMSKNDGDRPSLRVVEGNEDDSELVTSLHDAEEIVEMLTGDVVNKPQGVGTPAPRAPTPRQPSEMQVLPVMGVQTETVIETGEDGQPVIKDVPVLRSKATSNRQCSTCFVAANCPAFKPDSECAFGLPVEVKTKDQLMALLQTIIEMQGARVAFARFAEELNGGYPDPNTSQEMDRLFKLVGQLKEMTENKEYVRMTLERQGGQGVLSAIFGNRAQQLRELDNGGLSEEQTTQVIRQALEDE